MVAFSALLSSFSVVVLHEVTGETMSQADFVRFATKPSGSKTLHPVVTATRPRWHDLPATRVPLVRPQAASLFPRRKARLLEPWACRRLYNAVLRGRWHLTGHAFEMTIGSGVSLPSGEEAEKAAEPLQAALTEILQDLARVLHQEVPRLQFGIKAIGLLQHMKVTEASRSEGWRLLYFPHTLNQSNRMDGYSYVGGAFEVRSLEGEHQVSVLPEENVGYLLPAAWSITAHGPSAYLPMQLGISIIAEISAESVSDFWGAHVVGGTVGFGTLPQFSSPSFKFPGAEWLDNVHLFHNVLPSEMFAKLRAAVWRGAWTWGGTPGTTFTQAADSTQSELYLDPDVAAAAAPALDVALQLGEETTDLPMSYYHSYILFRARGHETPLHQDVGKGERRLWTVLFSLDSDFGADRELAFYTHNLQHVGTFIMTPNSAVLYPALLYHVGRMGISECGVSFSLGVRLAQCSMKEVIIDDEGHQIDICHP